MEWIRNLQEIFGADEPELISAYCRQYWQEDTEHVIRTADDACENTFLFDFTWDMERTWEPIHFEGEIDWSIIPKGDREFLWQFNRHRFLPCLAQAYCLTGEERYAQNYVRLLRDWIHRADAGVKESLDVGPWRMLETGIRAEMWLSSLPLILNSPAVTEDFLAEVEECMRRHQQRLLSEFPPYKYISNWGVIEACGLFLFSLALPGSEEAAQEALKRLSQSTQVQVLPDGMQWEQSPMYHNEVYHCYLNTIYYGRRAGLFIPSEIEDAARRMAYVDYKWKKPDHTQFTQGDSDASDLRNQITEGAYLFRDGMLKSGGFERPDYDSAWKFGWKGCEEYGKIRPEEPDFVSAELPFGGNYYLRSGWGEKENLLHFHCGETGGGHGHADKLHVDLVIHGEDVLVDSGRYTYMDVPKRYELKEAAAHNTVLVDGKGFSDCVSSWEYKNLCTCLKQQYYEGKSGSFVEGTHLGYLDRGVLTNRKVIWIHPDIYVLIDAFYTEGSHTYESCLHFDGSGEAELYTGKNGFPCVHFTGREMETYIQSVEKVEAYSLEETEQSSYYNEKHPNLTYRGRWSADGFTRRITVINGGEKGKTAPALVKSVKLNSHVRTSEVDPKDSEGVQIICGDREYVLFLCHREIMTPTDILRWENCVGHGKAVLFDRTEEKNRIITGEILAW